MSVRPNKPVNRPCPQQGSRESCPLVCKYNHFEADDLVIDSWELKCLDCGLRETIAYRSDEPADEEEIEGEVPPNPRQCPFCGLTGLLPGKNPCDNAEQTP